MKKSFRRLLAVILTVLTIVGTACVVSATAPSDSYNYWSNVGSKRKAVLNKTMYSADKLIDVSELGVNRLLEITAMCKDDQNNIYILDANSRIVVLDDDYNFVKEIGKLNEPPITEVSVDKETVDTAEVAETTNTETAFDFAAEDETTAEGETAAETGISYDGAKGIYYNNNVIYICNTEGANVYMTDLDGKLLDTIVLPDSDLIPDEDLQFRPIKIARDPNGYIYILSDGCFYGSFLFSPEREFLGFYGANTVKATVSSVLTNISNRLFPNPEKHANSIKKLPYPFVDIAVDSEGFVYTSNGYTDTSSAERKGQIRKLSPGYGTNILDSEANFTDERLVWVVNNELTKRDLCDIEIDENGFIYALESRYDKVYVFDPDSKMITTFGGGIGSGVQKGAFSNACAMVLKENGDEVLIADTGTGYITTFKINDYGSLVKENDFLTYEGHYDLVKEGWEEVLLQDNNCQVAYSGLANAYLEEENYDEALRYAKMGYDKKTYAVAFEYVRKDFISNNFTWIFIVLVVVVLGAIAFMFVTNKKKIVFIKNKSLNLMLTTVVHPSNNFTDIKEKGLGSLPLCFLLVIAYYVVTVMQTIAGGFLFSNYDPTSFNSIIEFVRSVGIVVLWIVSNWLVCTLLGGKGRLKEIIIITCYSLQPLILTGIIHIVLSNVLLPVEAGFLGILSTIGMIYAGFMLVTGMLKIHDYSLGRFIWTTILTLLGMAIIIFLIIMLIILVQQFGAFVVTLVNELMTM